MNDFLDNLAADQYQKMHKKEEIAEQELYDVEAIKKINEEIQIIKLEILEEELKLEVLKSKLNKKRLEIQYSMLEEENR
jgi:hypothetical protein